MIDPAHTWISVLLLAISLLIGAGVALPLLISPLGWAKRIGWQLPAETHLVVYLGRCLGGVALAIVYAMVSAAGAVAKNVVIVEMLICIGVLLVAVHVDGWRKKAQPLFETIEIGIYAVLTSLTVWARLTLES